MTKHKTKKIFVFGSNLLGRHGAGAALFAQEHHEAEYGVGSGRTGNAYAIPTKGRRFEILPLDVIQSYVNTFIQYAKDHPELEFEMTEVGCGLARGGMTKDERRAQIAPMFKDVPDNVDLPTEWKAFLCTPTGSSDVSSQTTTIEPFDIQTREA